MIDDDQAHGGTGHRRIMVSWFAVISGVGWLIDFGIFNALVFARVAPGPANMVSASVAVMFVFFISRRTLFLNARRPISQATMLYVVYNVAAVTAASALVGGLAVLLRPVMAQSCGLLSMLPCAWLVGVAPALAKVIVTPATMYANFVASSYINLKHFRFV